MTALGVGIVALVVICGVLSFGIFIGREVPPPFVYHVTTVPEAGLCISAAIGQGRNEPLRTWPPRHENGSITCHAEDAP